MITQIPIAPCSPFEAVKKYCDDHSTTSHHLIPKFIDQKTQQAYEDWVSKTASKCP